MIDTEALRKKVIDLAIQGKLTQQLPEDGNAEDLYAQIQKDKAWLIKEGKIKKEKSIPGIADDEIPFDIPDNWIWVRLRDVCRKIVDGDHNPPAGTSDKTEYLMLSAQNINNDELVNLENARYLTESVFLEENKRTQLEEGDVLLTIVATLGRSCVYRGQLNACFQRSVCVITTMIIPEYLKRVFDSGFIQKIMQDNATGAAQPGFYLNKVEKLCIPLPPVSEQKRIVDRIDNVVSQLNIIDSLQKKYESDWEILKGKIIDAGIQGRLTEQLPEDGDSEVLYKRIQENNAKLEKEGKIKKQKQISSINEDEIPFEIPSNWRWYRLGSIARIYGGKRIPAGRSLTDIDTGHKYIRISDMKDGTVLVNNLLYVPEDIYPSISRYIINKEDVYITVAGTIGKVGKIPSEIDGANLTENADRIVFDSIDQNWLIWCLSASFIQKQIVKLTTQVAQPKLAITRIQEFIIPLPPLAEQIRIANVIDTLMQTISY